VAVGEHEAALVPDCPLDRRDRRAWVVSAGDEPLELLRDAVTRRLGEEAAAPVEVDGGGGDVTSVPSKEYDRRKDGGAAERGGEKEEGGPEPRTALAFVPLPYLIWNVALPVVWFPAMSVASQRNSVVVVTTNDWPGSRGPVESHSVEVLSGFDPSVV
jgi:hypothetical protein